MDRHSATARNMFHTPPNYHYSVKHAERVRAWTQQWAQITRPVRRREAVMATKAKHKEMNR